MATVRITGPNDVPYEGKILPRDKAAPYNPVPDPNVPYQGSVLPRNKAALVTPYLDPYNKPGEIALNNGFQQITLPADTIPLIEGHKDLAMTHILDGTSVIERIRREPYRISFNGVLRMIAVNGQKYNGLNAPSGVRGYASNVFAQDYLNDVWNYIWIPDTVITVKNTFLNGLGVSQIVVEGMEPHLRTGTCEIEFVLTCWENEPGESIIIQPS